MIMHIGFFASFSRHISRTQSFQENGLIDFQVRVVLKPFISLIGHLVACSARISVDTHTHTHTHTHMNQLPHAFYYRSWPVSDSTRAI